MTDRIETHPSNFGAKFFIVVLLILIAAGAGAAAMWVLQVRRPAEANIDENRKMQLGLTSSSADESFHLADGFKDADGDLVADPPADPAKWIDPPKLVFCYIPQEDEEKYEKEWKPFCDHLAKVTGKPVEYLPIHTTEEQLKALADGKLQITGINTGAVPQAVNTCGFVPVCRVPTGDPTGTHIEIIVPANSTINKPQDLKDRDLTLTSPDSNSGYKVADGSSQERIPDRAGEGLQNPHVPGTRQVDRRHRQRRVRSGCGCVRHARAPEAKGTIQANQYRTIWKSESFPSAAIGYVYNVKPELAAKIKEAILTFDIKGTALEADFGDQSQSKFVPVSYKNDWALIRRIDEESARLRGSR